MQTSLNRAVAPVHERCPWCDTLISHAKFVQIEERIREQERKRVLEAEAKVRQELQTKFKQDVARVAQETEKRVRDEAAKVVAGTKVELQQAQTKVKTLEARESEIRKQAAGHAEKKHQVEILKQRQIFERDKDQAVLKVRAEVTREREGWQKKVVELERQLQKKTANDLGDGAEVDLYEALRDSFPRDHITRVGKGEPGADVHHEVLHHGQGCGLIVVDSKNRKAWQNAFVTKLRQDQVEAGAQHAILATTVFPAGEKELCIRDDVIVVMPARVPFIVQLLRGFMLRVHVQGLSVKEQSAKMSRLYKYITSDGCAQRFGEATKLANDIADLDVQETKDHQKVWEKRGRVTTRLKGVLRDLNTEIDAIIEGIDEVVEETA